MRAAVIDVGSSTIKLLIAESHGDDVKIIESLKNLIPLGKHVFLKGRIPQSIINQTAAVLQRDACRSGQSEIVTRGTWD